MYTLAVRVAPATSKDFVQYPVISRGSLLARV
jgi:hypothetical protein